MEVFKAIGPGARSAVNELLAFRNGSEGERCGMIQTLAQLGTPSGVILDVPDAAMCDPSGYVRCCAAHALCELMPEPARFVPLLIDACDWQAYLHDVNLPETAIGALAQYGRQAAEALPRLRQFVEGPIAGRTVRADLVRDAMMRISGDTAASPHREPTQQRTDPVADDEPLFAVRHQTRACYIDRFGQIVIRTQYTFGGPFREGRAIVTDDDRRTFLIDRQGREVFQCAWDKILPYSEGLAAVMKDEKWGFVDRDGRVVVEPQYDSVTSFSEGLAGFELGRKEVRLSNGVTRTRPGPRGFLDQSGKVAVPAAWADASRFREGRAVVCTGGAWKAGLLVDDELVFSDRKYGYIDRAGRLAIAGDYDEADGFSEGRAMVLVRDRALRYGYIDTNGEQVLPLKFTYASEFREGVAPVRARKALAGDSPGDRPERSGRAGIALFLHRALFRGSLCGLVGGGLGVRRPGRPVGHRASVRRGQSVRARAGRSPAGRLVWIDRPDRQVHLGTDDRAKNELDRRVGMDLNNPARSKG